MTAVIAKKSSRTLLVGILMNNVETCAENKAQEKNMDVELKVNDMNDTMNTRLLSRRLSLTG